MEYKFFNWKFSFGRDKPEEDLVKLKKVDDPKISPKPVVIPPGRVSVPNDDTNIDFLRKFLGGFLKPSFRTELIPLIRDLYKINPDMGIAVQDMYKLTNSGHRILFPKNTPEEADKMRDHLETVTKHWFPYTAGCNGMTNRLVVQALIGGAISAEVVVNKDISGLDNIILINPEDIIFKRLEGGKYEPYQINKSFNRTSINENVKLNPLTYTYLGLFNDTNEPYGIPPFLSALDALKTQSEMKVNINHIMEVMGLIGFVEALIAKPDQRSNESDAVYEHRLNRMLRELKSRTADGLKDGIVCGFEDDHKFTLNPTTKDIGNVPNIFNMNQQSVANGLGVTGSLIGVSSDNKTEGGTSIMFSKMISQLKNLHLFLSFFWEKTYALELHLAGFKCNGVKVEFNTSTVTDDLKIQQGKEIKIRNLNALYDQGIIGQQTYAYEVGYSEPDQEEPRVERDASGNSAKAEEDREKDKDTSDRKVREKNKPVPKRKDGNTKPV